MREVLHTVVIRICLLRRGSLQASRLRLIVKTIMCHMLRHALVVEVGVMR